MDLSERELSTLKKYLHSYVEKTRGEFIRIMSPLFGLLTAPSPKINFGYFRGQNFIGQKDGQICISTKGFEDFFVGVVLRIGLGLGHTL